MINMSAPPKAPSRTKPAPAAAPVPAPAPAPVPAPAPAPTPVAAAPKKGKGKVKAEKPAAEAKPTTKGKGKGKGKGKKKTEQETQAELEAKVLPKKYEEKIVKEWLSSFEKNCPVPAKVKSASGKDITPRGVISKSVLKDFFRLALPRIVPGAENTSLADYSPLNFQAGPISFYDKPMAIKFKGNKTGYDAAMAAYKKTLDASGDETPSTPMKPARVLDAYEMFQHGFAIINGERKKVNFVNAGKGIQILARWMECTIVNHLASVLKSFAASTSKNFPTRIPAGGIQIVSRPITGKEKPGSFVVDPKNPKNKLLKGIRRNLLKELQWAGKEDYNIVTKLVGNKIVAFTTDDWKAVQNVIQSKNIPADLEFFVTRWIATKARQISVLQLFLMRIMKLNKATLNLGLPKAKNETTDVYIARKIAAIKAAANTMIKIKVKAAAPKAKATEQNVALGTYLKTFLANLGSGITLESKIPAKVSQASKQYRLASNSALGNALAAKAGKAKNKKGNDVSTISISDGLKINPKEAPFQAMNEADYKNLTSASAACNKVLFDIALSLAAEITSIITKDGKTMKMKTVTPTVAAMAIRAIEKKVGMAGLALLI